MQKPSKKFVQFIKTKTGSENKTSNAMKVDIAGEIITTKSNSVH